MNSKIVIGFGNQIYAAIIAILATPFIISLIGYEAFGVVGIYALMNAWFGMLDFGLGGAITRKISESRGIGQVSRADKAFIKISNYFFLFCCLTLVPIGYFVLGSFDLHEKQQETNQLITSGSVSVLIISCIAIRFYCSYFRAILLGFEKMVFLSFTNSAMQTLRFIVVLPILTVFDKGLITFFCWQLITCIVEFLFLYFYKARFYQSDFLSLKKSDFISSFDNFKFALSLSFTSIVWVIMSSVDRVVLATTLSLDDFGKYSATLIIAMGVVMLNQPLLNALVPRLTNLLAEKDLRTFNQTILSSTRLLFSSLIPLGLVISFNAGNVIFAWAGDWELANYGSEILRFFVLGNLFVVIATIPYAIQIAYGDISLHVKLNLFILLTYIPSIIALALLFDEAYVARAWLVFNAIGFFILAVFCFKKFQFELSTTWWLDGFRNILIQATAVMLLSLFRLPNIDQAETFVWLCVQLCVLGIVSVFSNFSLIKIFREFRRSV